MLKRERIELQNKGIIILRRFIVIKSIAIVKDSIEDKFMCEVTSTVDDMQERGLTVDIQYKYENYNYIAFITGRAKNNV